MKTTGAKGTTTGAKSAAAARGGGRTRGAVAEGALREDPFRDRLLPLDPAAPVACMVTGEAQEPAEDAEPWADDAEMLQDAFAWAEARLVRLAAQLDVSARLGVTTDIDEDVRKWEGSAPRVTWIPEVLVRAEAQAKVLHSDWKGRAQPAEGVGRRALAEDFLFPYLDYDDAECRRDEAQVRLVRLSRLRLWMLRALDREVRASRRLLERRHATRATGWTAELDRVGDEAGLGLGERAVVVLALGVVLDPGVRRGVGLLAERGFGGQGEGVSAGVVEAFCTVDLRERMLLGRAIGTAGALRGHDLVRVGQGEDGWPAAAPSGVRLSASGALLERMTAA